MNRVRLLAAVSTLSTVSIATSAHADAVGGVGTARVLFPITPPPGSFIIENEDITGVTAGQVVGTAFAGGQYPFRAFACNGPAGATVDLTPTTIPGLSEADATATDGTTQVGFGSSNAVFAHALLWSGTAASAVDLNPTYLTGSTASRAYGVHGNRQVGDAEGNETGGVYHAMLWSGTAGSAIDLQPASIPNTFGSVAVATDGTSQVGNYYTYQQGFPRHALLWYGTAASTVKLQPAYAVLSAAVGVGDGQQVGYCGVAPGGSGTVYNHANLWTGTAASAVDLNPAGTVSSYAEATNGVEQVGYASQSASTPADPTDAYLWTGTAASAVNLSTLLPANGGTWATSAACSIDAAGDVCGFATETFANNAQQTFAVEWAAVPEPASAGVLALGVATLLGRRRRRT